MIIRYFFAFVALILITITSVAAQNLALTGSIRSGNGPVSGASVYVNADGRRKRKFGSGHVVGPVASGGNGQFSFTISVRAIFCARNGGGRNGMAGQRESSGPAKPIVLH